MATNLDHLVRLHLGSWERDGVSAAVSGRTAQAEIPVHSAMMGEQEEGYHSTQVEEAAPTVAVVPRQWGCGAGGGLVAEERLSLVQDC